MIGRPPRSPLFPTTPLFRSRGRPRGSYCPLPKKKPGARGPRPAMHRTLEFLLHHGYILLLGWVFAEQLGLPLPSMPLLLAAGAPPGSGHLSFFSLLFYLMRATPVPESILEHLRPTPGIEDLPHPSPHSP